ncbi:zinc knuckle-domain-containing protein [Xylariales sp. PMI_506]|nr:zinc knuckle-domain-containing protein [Xylariales sp. PMI_506]
MYRRGPSKATPSSVKCQKCLKTGHYSYECKASVQDRPYIPRPSRTQQLQNPKLVPKLTEAAPPELQKKKGVADEQLAKLEAERAKKRELERGDEPAERDDEPRRGRSASYDSVSTISTNGSPGLSKTERRRPSYNSASDEDQRRLPSPTRRAVRTSQSPVAGIRSPRGRIGEKSEENDYSEPKQPSRHLRRYSSSQSRSPPPTEQRRYRSRSSDDRRSYDSPPRDLPSGEPRERGYGRGNGRPRNPPPQREPRERSLSPFSKRLALTKSMGN